MKLNIKVQRMIKKKLFFTNSWNIEPSLYNVLVKELANEIIIEIEKEWNKKRSVSCK